MFNWINGGFITLGTSKDSYWKNIFSRRDLGQQMRGLKIDPSSFFFIQLPGISLFEEASCDPTG